MIKEHIKEKIFEHAISFEQYGLNDLAWERDKALALIISLKGEEIGISGGDVYLMGGKQPKSFGDNWACDPKRDEPQKEYFERSKEKAIKYIENFPIYKDEKILFSIVFTEQLV